MPPTPPPPSDLGSEPNSPALSGQGWTVEEPLSPGGFLPATPRANLALYEEETSAYGDAALTNGELFQYADPHDYRLDYVYDHFDYVHCDTLGANATAFPHFPRLTWAADAADGGDGGRDVSVAEDAAGPGPAAATVVPNSGQRTGAPGR